MAKLFKMVISIALLIVPPFYFGINGKTIQMGLLIIPTMMCVVLINLDDLKKSIVSIKTKDIEIKFQNAIDKAYATIEQLNKIQYVLTKVATEILYRQKFWGGAGVENTYKIIDDLYQAALQIKAQKIIDEPLKVAYQRLLSESFAHLTSGIKDDNDRKRTKDIFNMIYVFKGGTNIMYDGKYIPSKNAINNFIYKLNLKEESLKDMMGAIKLYGNVLMNYQQIHGNINVVDEITLLNGSEEIETKI